MARYIDVEKAEYPYMSMSMWGLNSKDCKAYNEGVKATEDMIQTLPTADVVSMEAHKQVRWERDMAVEQLASYGVCLGEDKELAEVKHGEWIEDAYYGNPCVCSCCGVEAPYFNKFEETFDYDLEKNLGSTGYKTIKEYIRTQYCHRCGAKMDGGGEK